VSAASRGAARERQVRRLLEADGWAVTRGAGSHGQADLWCARPRHEEVGGTRAVFVDLRLIQVKTDKGSPWANFRPKDRAELSALAAQTGGIAELWHWAPRCECRIYLEHEWPVASS
jgi:hypothetical protein